VACLRFAERSVVEIFTAKKQNAPNPLSVSRAAITNPEQGMADLGAEPVPHVLGHDLRRHVVNVFATVLFDGPRQILNELGQERQSRSIPVCLVAVEDARHRR
jgi:hypothetical protein